MRRGGPAMAGRMAGRRMAARMASRMRRRRRRRRVVLVGGLIAVGVHKLSKKDVERVEEHTGKTAEELSDEERDQAMKKISGKPEITRFKGLGEISPSEFKAFIGEEMKLTPVVVKNEHSIPEVLSFYMGKNTQERREYIMENLVTDY